MRLQLPRPGVHLRLLKLLHAVMTPSLTYRPCDTALTELQRPWWPLDALHTLCGAAVSTMAGGLALLWRGRVHVPGWTERRAAQVGVPESSGMIIQRLAATALV